MIQAPNQRLLQVLVAAGATLAILGCDNNRASPPATAAADGAKPSAANVPPKPVADPSLPSAASAVGNPPSASMTAQDSKATAPMADSSKTDEQQQMPKANQANNHSSPSVEPSGTGGQQK